MELFPVEDAKPMTDVAIVEADAPLVRLAIENKADPSVIERLVDLMNKQEDRRAKQEFDLHFAAMQAELPIITKRKEAKNQSEVMYVYAPLEVLQRACNPIISRHGFSYSWREEAIEGKSKRTILAIRGYGHVQENYFDAPEISGTSRMNPIQVAGAMSSYGRRYTFIAGFGLTVEGEDLDGQTLDEGSLRMDLQEYIKSGKLSPEAVSIITKELMKGEPDEAKLRNYWKRARAKVEGK
jgi:hypothetical protein